MVDAMQIDWSAVGREVLIRSLFFLRQERSISLERSLRGRSEFNKMQRADCVVVSFPNSGRTWLRVLLARYYQVRESMKGQTFLDLDILAKNSSAVPHFHFTHDNYLRDYTGHDSSKVAYQNKRVILLVRDPADVAVSQYYQWKHRMRRRKMRINHYPLEPEIPLFEFVTRPDGVLPRITRFMNEWARELPQLNSVFVVRYEDLRADTERTFMEILEFIGTPGNPEQIRNAISFASLANMRKLEESGNPLLRSGRLMVGRNNDSNHFKARRAKIGGYRGDFSADEIVAIDRSIDTQLSPIFRYHRHSPLGADSDRYSARMRSTT